MPNSLAEEKSPYLLQHKDNPVNWLPWCDLAFERARYEDKPIFLSIGYSTCHWCHVMAHESFEDSQVAAILNSDFICIKVDREERPDIDASYMRAVQLMQGRGGWPLSVFLDAEKRPFFGGTYFPKNSYSGGVGFLDLLARLTELWQTRRQDVLTSGQKLLEAVIASGRIEEIRGGAAPSPLALSLKASQELTQSFDAQNGGFGVAPKFPSLHNLVFLFRYQKLSSEAQAGLMAEKTLNNILKGGIYDQLGFGIHRYSTDGQWLLPHFEKMLYDQASLLLALSEAYASTKKAEYKLAASALAQYLKRDLLCTETGAFFAAEDADTEGEEGKFYVWTADELKSALGEEYEEFKRVFSIEEAGNFREEATRKLTGQNVLAIKPKIPLAELFAPEGKLAEIRAKLLALRATRERPMRDEKILLDWNAYMIAALAKASRVFEEPEYLKLAENAFAFLETSMLASSGELRHCYKDKLLRESAYADDYAYTIWACLELQQSSFKPEYLERAQALQEIFTRDFLSPEQNAFLNTALGDDDAPSRHIDLHDGAMPSANSVAVGNLLKLFLLTGQEKYAALGENIFLNLSPRIVGNPSNFTHLLSSSLLLDFRCQQVFALPSEAQNNALVTQLKEKYLPFALFKPALDEKCEGLQLCRGTECLAPILDSETLTELLNGL